MDDTQARQANRLYWESQKSVNQIADELDMSKGALYSAIDPLPTDRSCPRCGAPLGYANRTAHERGELSCASCDYQVGDEETVESGAADGARSEPVTGSRAIPPPADEAHRYVGTRMLVGGAALCLGVGLLLGRMLPRR